jgi:cell division protein FtsQ
MSASGVIAVPAPRGLRWRGWRGLVGRRTRLTILALLVVAVLGGGGWLWFRDSSFVAVQKVTVTGESGPDAAAISSALQSSARSMTTLDVQIARLYAAVAAYPVVQSLKVTTQFPHGMVIRVIERPPVAMVIVAGHREAVSADGSLLHDLTPAPALPRIGLAVPPGGPRLSDPQTLEELAAVTAAPRPIRARIVIMRLVAGPGLVASIRHGPAIYLGDATQLRAKWASAAAVMADPGSVGASYIDVSDPRRPAAGATASGTGYASSSQTSKKGSTTPSATDTQPPPSIKGSAWRPA